MKIGKYSMGIGDRFGQQGKAQLAAFFKAKEMGVDVTPVWNKSFREHSIIHTGPADTRAEADAATTSLGWDAPYFVDADHVGLKIIDPFIPVSDFFTLDVADFINEKASKEQIETFVQKQQSYLGELSIPGIEKEFIISEELVHHIGEKYLFAIQEAGKIYRRIRAEKTKDSFITEVSMDETDEPQTPLELLFILAAIAGEGIPAQTIAPKFTGRFNKGVDYAGDVSKFTQEFEQDLAVINFAIEAFKLPSDLKLSVHSGSDKFSIYKPMAQAIKKFDAGLHIKTAGTTWLEELIGLAEAGGNGLVLAKDVYKNAMERYEELARPYASVIDIDVNVLPSSTEVDAWDGQTYAQTLRHDQSNPRYNSSFRQLLHVGYKVAAEMGDKYLSTLQQNESVVAKNVSANIFDRHLAALFINS